MNIAKWMGVAFGILVLGNILVWVLDAWLGGGCIVRIPGYCETPRGGGAGAAVYSFLTNP